MSDTNELRPEAWRKAVMEAYGHLWHVNNEPLAPIPLRSPEKAAYEARKCLRELLTHQERGEAINAVGELIGRFADTAKEQPYPAIDPLTGEANGPQCCGGRDGCDVREYCAAAPTAPAAGPQQELPYGFESGLVQLLNEARCLSKETVGNRQLASRIIRYMRMRGPAPAVERGVVAANGGVSFQGGMSNVELEQALHAKIPGVKPTDGELSSFALGVEVGTERAVALTATGAAPAVERGVTEAPENSEFKNFHRALCERFNYSHDPVDWRRDQVSLIEHIAALTATTSPSDTELAAHEEMGAVAMRDDGRLDADNWLPNGDVPAELADGWRWVDAKRVLILSPTLTATGAAQGDGHGAAAGVGRGFDRQSFDLAGFTAALQRAMDARSKTAKEVSAETGVSETTLSRMKSAERAPDAASLAALSAWAGLNPASFCGSGWRSAQQEAPAAQPVPHLPLAGDEAQRIADAHFVSYEVVQAIAKAVLAAPAVQPLTPGQITAIRADWINARTQDECSAFYRGFRAAEHTHGIQPAATKGTT